MPGDHSTVRGRGLAQSHFEWDPTGWYSVNQGKGKAEA